MSLGPLMIDLRGTSIAADEREWLESPLVGGVILFSRNFESLDQLRELVADIHGIRQPPLLVTVDHEGGRVQRFKEPFFRLPPLRALGHLYDENRERALKTAAAFGWLMAAELRAVGVDMSFTPCVDLDLGLSEIIGDRALHSDARAVAALARRFAAGAKRAGMAVTAKHFPTHAGARSDSHTEFAVDRRSYDDLTDDLLPYRELIRAGLPAAMIAHVSFPAVDERPASLSRWWIEDQLRGVLGFTGAVITDDVSMVGAAVVGPVEQRVRLALDAGCDLVLLCNSPDEVPPVLEALRGYVNPTAQLRLTRLHGRGTFDWENLHASADWQRASAAVGALDKRPKLDLEG
ncbi:MAG TPA: beta-N-acetylhexosaminidase [Gammaproteobacteria bacterium]|nr:beta-N-acetylhexosaminidase [Gammaproteobacteria bacterium]